MSNFQTSVDIANRACQHVGARRISSLTENSKQAAAVSFCYDKLREAELRRNVWTFSVRKAAIRPLGTTTTRLRPTAWAVGTTYALGAIVASGGLNWESLAAGNVGQTPGLDASAWELYAGPLTISVPVVASSILDTAYFSGELILGNGSSDTTTVYRSLVSNNSDIPPTANWLSLGAISAPLSILYPVGAGPVTTMDTRNVFVIPDAYLRTAPQDPKAGNISYLGAPHGNPADDWTYENGFIVSATDTLIVLRFVASVTKTPNFDPMYCEGLAARIGLEVCEEITQSAEKLNTIASAYKTFMGEARIVNGIEQGPVESPEDDYISCRI